MKFGEELLSKMVPEWQHAYVDYESLKEILEKIELTTNTNTRATLDGARNHQGSTFCGLFSTPGRQRRGGGLQMTVPVFTTRFPVVVEEGGGENENYYNRLFIQRRDDEFEKVSEFYEQEVANAKKEEAMLMRELNGLIELRSKVTKALKDDEANKGVETWEAFRGWKEYAEEITRLASDIVTSAADISDSIPAIAKSMNTLSQAYMEITEEGESIKGGQLDDDDEEEDNGDIHDGDTSNDTRENRKKSVQKVKKSMQKLRVAFVEFYQKLLLLKSYSFMNVKAFSKIMKKYDKITSSDARMTYMKMVDNSYLGSSDEVDRLIESVENSFVKHIAKSNRTKGMNILRPKVLRERHRLTFSTGFSAGCLFSLIVALATIIRTRDILQKAGHVLYMDTMFPLYSFFGFIVLHIIMYAVNIYYWRRYKINYSFIFQFKKGTELGHTQILLLAFTTGVFALLCVLANLDMEIDPVTKKFQKFTELLPLILLLGIFLVIIMPFKFFYHENRRFFLIRLYHFFAAPLFKVTFPDFFLGDQLTSQVQAFRSIEFYICYYGWGDFSQRKHICDKSDAYKGFFFIVAVIPYVSRLLQCLRRLFEEEKTEQGWNALKYFLTIVAVCFRTAYSIQQGQIIWRILAIITSVVAAIFGTYWDFVHDWGLLNRTSNNKWLRDKLLIPQKKVYFIAMILNVLLRFAWIETVLDFKIRFMHKQTMVTVVASLEIIRRGIWNFFRLENEQLNNAGEYRDFKSVPQASNYGGKKDD